VKISLDNRLVEAAETSAFNRAERGECDDSEVRDVPDRIWASAM
jgi:hypothetical protein